MKYNGRNDRRKAMDDLRLRASYADLWCVQTKVFDNALINEDEDWMEGYELHFENDGLDNNTIVYSLRNIHDEDDEITSGSLPGASYWGEWIDETYENLAEFKKHLDYLEMKSGVTYDVH